jgi:arylsulfatase
MYSLSENREACSLSTKPERRIKMERFFPTPCQSLFIPLILVWIACACGKAPLPVPEGPNILYIVTDTLRSDLLGCYGNEGGHTPNIDALAREGVLFENCGAPMATTFPSHASMFTGLYPRYHGVRWNGHRLHRNATTLAEVLSGHGFATAAFIAYQAMLNRGGLDQGFQQISPARAGLNDTGIRSGRDVNRMAMRWLEDRDPDRPFFLWVHYFEPHGPYPVTPYAKEVLARENYDGPFVNGMDLNNDEQKAALDDPVNQRALRTLYAGRVREADACVGELLAFLGDRGLTDDTVVVFTGDHGQLLGEVYRNRPRFGHGPTLWEPALRVPLIIRDPRKDRMYGVDRGEAPRRINQRVGLVDVLPTVLDLLGLETPDTCHGRTLCPVLRGEPIPQRTYLAEIRTAAGAGSKGGESKDRIAVYDQGKKVMYPDGIVYDITRAGSETEPLAPGSHQALIDRLAKIANHFFEHRASLEGAYDLDEEDIAHLKALGYLK